MTDANFTPGPWKWEIDGKGTAWAAYSLSPGVLLTDFGSGTPWGDEIDRANADLIAAAPDLYEALSDCLWMIEAKEGTSDENDKKVDAARAALAKARGDANG